VLGERMRWITKIGMSIIGAWLFKVWVMEDLLPPEVMYPLLAAGLTVSIIFT